MRGSGRDPTVLISIDRKPPLLQPCPIGCELWRDHWGDRHGRAIPLKHFSKAKSHFFHASANRLHNTIHNDFDTFQIDHSKSDRASLAP